MKKPYSTTERIAVAVGGAFLDSWFVMLLLGAAHSSDSRVPALSYWVTFAVCYAISCVAGTSALSANMNTESRR